MKNKRKTMYSSPQSEIIELKLSGSIAQITVTSPNGMIGDNPNGDTFSGGGEDW